MLDKISFGVVRFVAALVWTGENLLGSHWCPGLLRLGHTEALVVAIVSFEASGRGHLLPVRHPDPDQLVGGYGHDVHERLPVCQLALVTVLLMVLERFLVAEHLPAVGNLTTDM